MKKKLNLVLREPVRLHQTEANVTPLPAPFEDREKVAEQLEKPKKPKQLAAVNKPEEFPPPKPVLYEREVKDLTKQMSPRILQIWKFFCRRANEDGNLKNSFTVTRNEVLREAQIGSTNTYRDALRKFRDLGLIEIELRPGVISGSVFYLTKLGQAQASLTISGA